MREDTHEAAQGFAHQLKTLMAKIERHEAIIAERASTKALHRNRQALSEWAWRLAYIALIVFASVYGAMIST